ncbi:MAG: hypothetical protein QXU18_09820 [Thermoplasmatales archaeon]
MAKEEREMFPDDFDAFTFSEGFESEFDGLITDAYFDIDNNYKEDTLLMHWHVKNLDTGEDLQHPLKFSCGNNWYTKDGNIALHRNEHKVFNKNSVYAIVCNKCITEMDMLPILESRFPRKTYGFRQAKGWKGLKFHFAPVQMSYDGLGEKANRAKIMPVAFLGEDKKSKETTKVSTKAKDEKSSTDSAAKRTMVASLSKKFNIDPDALAKLSKEFPGDDSVFERVFRLTQKSEDFDSFVSAIFDIDEVNNNEELQQMLIDRESWWDKIRED